MKRQLTEEQKAKSKERIEFAVVFGGTLGCLGTAEWARFSTLAEAKAWMEVQGQEQDLSIQEIYEELGPAEAETLLTCH